MKHDRNRDIAFGGMTAALYVVLTLVSQMMGLASGLVQVRLSEALCVLPCFSQAAVPGLFIGCLIANLLAGSMPLDVIFGSIATLLGAIGTRLWRKNRYLCCLPPVISNTLIVPVLLKYVYGVALPLWLSALYILAGESLSCMLFGQFVYTSVQKYIKKRPENAY